MTTEELEAAIKACTSRLDMLDQVIKSAKMGAPVTIAFKCNHSGLYYPADYVKEWGKLYGHGLGPDPVSEMLDSDYDTPPPRPDDRTMDITTIMHPLRVTRVQVDLVTVPQDEYDENRAVIAIDDPRIITRAKICRAKQLDNPKGGELRSLQANWMAITGAVVLGRRVA